MLWFYNEMNEHKLSKKKGYRNITFTQARSESNQIQIQPIISVTSTWRKTSLIQYSLFIKSGRVGHFKKPQLSKLNFGQMDKLNHWNIA